MNCPSCKATKQDPPATLQKVQLEENLTAQSCPTCEGHWIDSQNYERWLKKNGTTIPSLPEGVGFDAPREQLESALLCQKCDTLMVKAKVGLGLSYLVDRCVSCQSLWLDAQEWDSLKSRNLHDEIYFMYSSIWREKQKRHDAESKSEDE